MVFVSALVMDLLHTVFNYIITSRHLGGKFGQQLTNELGITHMGQLRKFSKAELQRKLGAKQG